MSSDGRPGRLRYTPRSYDSTQTMLPSGSATIPLGYASGSSSRHSPVPSAFSAKTRPGLRSFGQVVGRIGEVEPPVGPERQVVGRLERDAVDLGRDGLDPPVGPWPSGSTGRASARPATRPTVPPFWVMYSAVRARACRHSGRRRSRRSRGCRARADHATILRGVRLDHDDPAVGQDVGSLGMAQPVGERLHREAHGDPFLAAVRRPTADAGRARRRSRPDRAM